MIDLRNWKPTKLSRTTCIIEWLLLGALLYTLATSIKITPPAEEADTCTVGVDCCESGL